MRPTILLLAVVWLLTACAASDPGREPALSASDADPGPTDASTNPSGVRPTVTPAASLGLPASIIDPVVAEIARVAGVTTAEVVVTSAETVTFPDGGLGCPEPGRMYIQVQVDGYKIVAIAGGVTYDYRGSGRSGFRRCL